MGPISNTGSVPKTVTWYWHFVCPETIQNGGSFYRKVLLLHDIWLLLAETWVSKNWQLLSNFSTHKFWSQNHLKTNWAHFFEHKECPQCTDIWQSLTKGFDSARLPEQREGVFNPKPEIQTQTFPLVESTWTTSGLAIVYVWYYSHNVHCHDHRPRGFR